MGPFFYVLKKKFFTWEVKQRVVLEVNFFLLKKKGPMGVVEGCLGYWCWDSYNGYFCQRFSSFLGACQGVFGPFGLILISNSLGAEHAFPR
jgi:hypothetical protein